MNYYYINTEKTDNIQYKHDKSLHHQTQKMFS